MGARRSQPRMRGLPWPAGPLAMVATLVVALSGCSKRAPQAGEPAAAPPPPPTPAAPVAPTAPAAATSPPAPATPTGAAPAAAAAAADPKANAWGIVHPPARVKVGDRAYVVTKGRDRSMTDDRAVYQLFAHDVATVEGDIVEIAEVGGSSFRIGAAFVLRAGVERAADLKVGDPVLAEWASSLKHAVVEGFEGPADAPERVRIRYTDLPETWGDDKVTASRAPRELTKLVAGMHPGNWAVVHDDGRDLLVMLLAETPQGWLVQRFGGRIAVFAAERLQPLPPDLQVAKGAKVRVPWIGVMMPGKVVRSRGVWTWVKVEGIGQTEPIAVARGQVQPEPPPAGK